MEVERTGDAITITDYESKRFDLAFDYERIERRITEWRVNAELSKICDQFVQFMNEQN